MGWFDNEKQQKTGPGTDAERATPAATPPTSTPTPAPPPAKATRSGSSVLGERIHIDGKIVTDEDLTIEGRIEGTIHAQHSLVVAKGARVQAVVHGRRVTLDGELIGDVYGSEIVVLGPTASLRGNIHAPTLQIHEGAFFKGAVDMKPKATEARPTAQPGQKPAAGKPSKSASTGSDAQKADAKSETGGSPSKVGNASEPAQGVASKPGPGADTKAPQQPADAKGQSEPKGGQKVVAGRSGG